MFRFQDNLPEVYINESRDFQLLARLSDVLFSGLKYDIDSMINILDATLAKDRMLELMCTKIGFFPKIEMDSQVLKYIIASFPYIIKNKGNILGIQYAVNAILKAENNPDAVGEPKIVIINEEKDMGRNPYTIYIYTTVKLYNQPALKEILRYVLPAGYSYQIAQYKDVLEGYNNPDIINQSDSISAIKVKQNYNAELRLPNTDLTIYYNGDDINNSDNLNKDQKDKLNALADAYTNAYDTVEIITPATGNIEVNNNIKPVTLKDNSILVDYPIDKNEEGN